MAFPEVFTFQEETPEVYLTSKLQKNESLMVEGQASVTDWWEHDLWKVTMPSLESLHLFHSSSCQWVLAWPRGCRESMELAPWGDKALNLNRETQILAPLLSQAAEDPGVGRCQDRDLWVKGEGDKGLFLPSQPFVVLVFISSSVMWGFGTSWIHGSLSVLSSYCCEPCGWSSE